MRCKNSFIAGVSIIVIGSSGLLVNASSEQKHSSEPLLEQNIQQYQSLLRSQFEENLIQAEIDMNNMNATQQSNNSKRQIEESTSEEIKQHKKEIEDHLDGYISELEDTKKELENDIFGTYKREKKDEIDTKMEETIEELLD